MPLNFCAGAGVVARTDRPMPADPSAFHAVGIHGTTPCNHLHCSECGADVRWLDHARFEGRREWLRTGYDAADLLTARGVSATDLDVRLYLCRCSVLNCLSTKNLALREDLFHDELPASWACGGHAPLKLPADLFGVSLSADPSWGDVVADAFRQPRDPADPARWTRWLRAAFARLAGTPHQAAVDEAVGACLASTDPALRRGAISVLWNELPMPAAEGLRDLVLEHAEALKAEPDPKSTTSLYVPALRAALFVAGAGRVAYDLPLQEHARAFAEEPGGLDRLALFLAEHDREWLVANRERLLAIAPDARDELARWLA